MTDNIIQPLNSHNYPYDPIRNIYSFEKYLKNYNSYNLMYGGNCYNGEIYETHKNVIIDLEEPNFFFISVESYNTRMNMMKYLYKKITLCPYSAKLINTILRTDNAVSCFFPVDNDYLVENLGIPDYNKPIEVVYIGHNVSPITWHFLQFNPPSLSMPTYIDKIKTLYNSKISICHNVLFMNEHPHLYSSIIQHLPEIANEKFEIPQLKSRVFESGFAKCIPLVYFDNSKIIEEFFEPDVDFIYFYTLEDLQLLINKILSNYDSYKFIAENIYKKCNDNYKISDFVNKYIL